MAVSVSNVDLKERVRHLTNKIYREMLRKKTRERLMYLTIGPGRLDHGQVFGTSRTPPNWIALSWDLLAWISVKGRIPRSFTNFITTPELSGPLYIRPDIYHTEVTEYLLEKIYQ